jgi:hypothetical protein
MKTFTLTILSIILSTSAFAQSRELSDRALAISDRLSTLEKQLDRRDARDIERALSDVEYLLARYNDYGDSVQLTCLSNGQSSAWEKFRITDLNTNKTLGGETSRSICQSLIESQTKGMICLSNGQSSAWEKFRIYDFRTGQYLGGETTLSACKNLMETSNKAFICLSNGQSSAWEKFTLFNRQTQMKLGGETTLATCLSSIPK